ncbi:hypothetical protein GA0070216_10123 [Micromonospora matsumotoense]|uniref:Uncharacterized protein n=1 Tax=Micromonospora matsumotoense TaxID=121616 RepID=A0A1C4TW62_9ACTN|nr:hypothetical protein [Micromonospora matsumotoense]SCE63675.1 hypothetical protein GA0070216_10123 [Micromonospora matsumotoense]
MVESVTPDENAASRAAATRRRSNPQLKQIYAVSRRRWSTTDFEHLKGVPGALFSTFAALAGRLLLAGVARWIVMSYATVVAHQ